MAVFVFQRHHIVHRAFFHLPHRAGHLVLRRQTERQRIGDHNDRRRFHHHHRRLPHKRPQHGGRSAADMGIYRTHSTFHFNPPKVRPFFNVPYRARKLVPRATFHLQFLIYYCVFPNPAAEYCAAQHTRQPAPGCPAPACAKYSAHALSRSIPPNPNAAQ